MNRIIILLFVLPGITLFADEDDVQTVRSLSEQGLFNAVEALCQERFQQPNVAEKDKIQLATELVQSRSMQLFIVDSVQRNRIVQQIASLEKMWLVPLSQSLYQQEKGQNVAYDLALAKIMFRLQCAIAHRTLGDYLRLEADTASETDKQTAYQAARFTLQDALDRLKVCQKELQAFRQQVGNNISSQLNKEMLAAEYSIAMQQGIALKSSALTLPAEAERNFELRQAAEAFSILATKDSTDPAIVQCKIEKAACHRLCGEFEKCAEILTQLLNTPASLTPKCRLQAEAEWIRYNAATGNLAETRRRYTADRAESKLCPDFDLARLELFLASDPARNVRPEIPAAMKLQETMARQLGTYWGQRAALTMKVLSKGNTESISVEMLATLADIAYRENRFAESAKHYEEAAAKADASRQVESIYRYKRLAIEAWMKVLELVPDAEKNEYRNRLITLLQNLSMQFPNQAEAENLHLRAIDLQGEIIVSQPVSQAERQAEPQNDYLTLILEHMETWKESPQMARLRRLSVILLERQGRIGEASAMLPLLDLKQMETLPPEIQRLWIRQLDVEGKTQESVEMLTTLLKQKREPATLQLLAEILSRQTDKKSWDDALIFWTQLEQSVPKNSETWWTAKDGIIDVLCKLNRQEDAKKSFNMLRTLYPDLGGPESKERLTKRFAVP